MSRSIFITGCSSGIGAAMAAELHHRGHQVYATARRPESLAPLAELGIATLQLDVDDDDSIAAAMAAVEERQGRLDMLVNNAGFSQVGAVVDLSREALRQQGGPALTDGRVAYGTGALWHRGGDHPAGRRAFVLR